MDASIRRVLPEAAIQPGAARPVGPRRERAGDPRSFADELASRDEGPGRDDAGEPEVHLLDAPTGDPLGADEIGGRLDVVG